MDAGERVVLGEKGDGSSKFHEKVVLAHRHLLDIGLGPLVGREEAVDDDQALVVENVPVVVVVKLHGRAAVVPHVLYGFGDPVGAPLLHPVRVEAVR